MSLEQLFTNAAHYQQLAGEMKSQDLAILRFLLAILTTVYSRYNADGKPYEWLTIDEQSMRPVSFDEDEFEDSGKDDLLQTWNGLYHAQHFTEIVTRYLQKYADRFDLLSSEHLFTKLHGPSTIHWCRKIRLLLREKEPWRLSR